jgi:type II secretory pathway pseudopilin PulG
MRQVRAFTLVELLVVTGIIAVLVGVLIPVLSRARENARRVGCASNMRQLATAFLMYANDNRQRFPFSAAAASPWPHDPYPEDWIHWQDGRNLADSALARYLAAGAGLSDVLRCPSDDFDRRETDPDAGFGAYRYSYAMNAFLASDWSPNRRAIRRPAEMILLIDQDGDALRGMGGNWGAGSFWLFGYLFELSARHDPAAAPRPTWRSEVRWDSRAEKDDFGNLVFCDSHVEYVTRIAVLEHYTRSDSQDW